MKWTSCKKKISIRVELVYELPLVCLNSCLPSWFFFFTKSILSNYQIHIHFIDLLSHQIHITKVTLPTCQFHSSMTNTKMHHKLAIGLINISCPNAYFFSPTQIILGSQSIAPIFKHYCYLKAIDFQG